MRLPFPRKLLSDKNVIVALLFAILTSFSLSLVIFNSLLDEKLAQISNQHSMVLSKANQSLNTKLGDIRNSTILINNHVIDLLRVNHLTATDVFIHVGKNHPSISQMRWLSTDGQEKIRVNFRKNGHNVVSKERLQNKNSRYYFQEALKNKSGEVYLSSIDLNIENGKIEYPLTPTIRSAITGKDHPLGNGVFIINFALNPLFDELRNASNEMAKILVAKGSGEWMLSPSKNEEWALMLGSKESSANIRLATLWSKVLQNGSESMWRDDNNAIYSAIALNPHGKESFEEESVVLFAYSPPAIYKNQFHAAFIPALFTGIVIGFVFIVWFLRDRHKSLRLNDLAKRLANDRDALQKSLNERELLQEELVESEKLASLGLLVSGVAHELNTPIGGGIMAVSGLQNKVVAIKELLPDKLSYDALHNFLDYADEAVELTLGGLNKSAEIIKRFKRLSIDRGSDDIIVFSLGELLNDLIVSMKPLLKPKRVSINLDIDDDIEMQSYPGVVSQVLQNLVANAAEHAFDGNSANLVTIKVSGKETVTISVCDNGQGIPKKLMSTIFDPFVTSARANGNSGLGLHLVYLWTVNNLRGKINVKSGASGTNFTLIVPANIAVMDPDRAA